MTGKSKKEVPVLVDAGTKHGVVVMGVPVVATSPGRIRERGDSRFGKKRHRRGWCPL